MTQQPRNHADRLTALREARARPTRDAAAGPLFTAAARDLHRLEKKLAGVAEAWEAVCPNHLLERTSILSVSRGVLSIGVADAPARFEIDRLLGAGAKRELIRRCPMTVRRIRLVADAPRNETQTR